MEEEFVPETAAVGVPRPSEESAPDARRPWHRIGGVARNFVVVGGATALGQGALVLAAPILARLYDPLDFGLLSLYAAILAVLLVTVSLRYDFAIPIATDDEEAVHLVELSVLLDLAASVGLGIVVLLWRDPICSALGAPELAEFLWILPIALFVAGFSQAAASWGVYQRRFAAVGRMRAMQGLGQTLAQVLLGAARVGPVGLIAGDLFGRIAGTEQLLRPLTAAVRSTRKSLVSLRHGARQWWGFARVMTVASLLNALALQVPFLLIPVAFDLQSSGQYFLANRILVLPASLVSAAVSQVFFGEASFRRGDAKRLHDLAFNVTVSLLVFSIPVYLTMLVAGPALVATVFGSQWHTAGGYAQILAPGLVLWSVASPISALLLVGRRERESLLFSGAELCLKTLSLGIGAAAHSLTVGLVLMSISLVATNIGALWRFLRVGSVSLVEVARPAGRIVALTLPSIGLVLLIEVFAPPATAPVAMAGWAVAFALAARFSPEVRALLSGAHD
jgi:O-antigen/teichoic acid export membrane protein